MQVHILFLLLLVLCTAAQAQTKAVQLSNVQLLYAERLPNGQDDPSSPNAKLVPIFRKMESRSGIEASVTDGVSGIDLIKLAADRTAHKYGYLELPPVLLGGFVRAFNAHGVHSFPMFRTTMRTQAQAKEIAAALEQRYGLETQPAKFSLLILPYRAAYHESGDAIVRIGLTLYDVDAKQWIWLYQLNVPLGPTLGRTKDADADTLAAGVMSDFLKRGWLAPAQK
jgi:hypothetical protein